MYIPTGAMSLEKRMPEQIFQGRSFGYSLVVTNLTDMTLESVRISETMPENFNLTGSSPYEAVRDGSKAVWTIPSLPRARSTTRSRSSRRAPACSRPMCRRPMIAPAGHHDGQRAHSPRAGDRVDEPILSSSVISDFRGGFLRESAFFFCRAIPAGQPRRVRRMTTFSTRDWAHRSARACAWPRAGGGEQARALRSKHGPRRVSAG